MQPIYYSAFPYQQQPINFCPVQQVAPIMYYQQPQYTPQQIIYSQPSQMIVPQQQTYQQISKLYFPQTSISTQQSAQYAAISPSQIKMMPPTQQSQKQKNSHSKVAQVQPLQLQPQPQKYLKIIDPQIPIQTGKIVQSQQIDKTTSPERISPQKSLEERLQDLDRKLVETLKKSQEITKKLNQESNN